MIEGTVSEWLVADGAQALEGRALYSLESDKAVQEIDAPASGTLRIIIAAGETHPVGTVLATIESIE
jgi:pyruvate/2-oxoglutarate dehydrogenase complex dihydrolipoamide acyltransferase (E2) component